MQEEDTASFSSCKYSADFAQSIASSHAACTQPLVACIKERACSRLLTLALPVSPCRRSDLRAGNSLKSAYAVAGGKHVPGCEMSSKGRIPTGKRTHNRKMYSANFAHSSELNFYTPERKRRHGLCLVIIISMSKAIFHQKGRSRRRGGHPG